MLTCSYLVPQDVEWRKARQDLNKQWRPVLENNFHKSLDHQSSYFKQKDKKILGNTELLREMIEATSAGAPGGDAKTGAGEGGSGTVAGAAAGEEAKKGGAAEAGGATPAEIGRAHV